MTYWLLKTEPETFGIDNLAQLPNKTTSWEGVRNYQARNLIREMQVGDQAFFYHSSCAVPGIVGTVKIVRAAYPDDTAFEPKSPYYDPKATPANPRWFRVDVKLKEKFNRIITLSELRGIEGLRNMVLLRKGNRLSVSPVTEKEWKIICNLE